MSDVPGRATRRTAEERAEARALGVDRYGRPTQRALGVSPRQLKNRFPDMSPNELNRLAHRLRRDELRRRGLLSPGSVAVAAPRAALLADSPRDRRAVKGPQAPTPTGLTD
jgi:hypothetical protein